MNRQKIIFFIAELLAVAALRAVMIMQREKRILPRGGKVGKIKGKSVFRFPVFKRVTEKSTPDPEPEAKKPYEWTPPVAQPKETE